MRRPWMIGSANEHTVAAFLLRHEYEVYFPLGTAPCDMIAYREDVGFKRVEVKAGATSPKAGGERWFAHVPNPEKCDWLFFVSPAGNIIKPELVWNGRLSEKYAPLNDPKYFS